MEEFKEVKNEKKERENRKEFEGKMLKISGHKIIPNVKGSSYNTKLVFNVSSVTVEPISVSIDNLKNCGMPDIDLYLRDVPKDDKEHFNALYLSVDYYDKYKLNHFYSIVTDKVYIMNGEGNTIDVISLKNYGESLFKKLEGIEG